jgi:hypothetical protein
MNPSSDMAGDGTVKKMLPSKETRRREGIRKRVFNNHVGRYLLVSRMRDSNTLPPSIWSTIPLPKRPQLSARIRSRMHSNTFLPMSRLSSVELASEDYPFSDVLNPSSKHLPAKGRRMTFLSVTSLLEL